MTSEVGLRLVCRGAAEAEALSGVLSPDNRGLPAGQSLKMERRGKAVAFRLAGPVPWAVAPAVASILADASLFQEVWLLSRNPGAPTGRRK